jgi:hypothetical protein
VRRSLLAGCAVLVALTFAACDNGGNSDDAPTPAESPLPGAIIQQGTVGTFGNVRIGVINVFEDGEATISVFAEGEQRPTTVVIHPADILDLGDDGTLEVIEILAATEDDERGTIRVLHIPRD